MPNWFVAAHGGIPHAQARGFVRSIIKNTSDVDNVPKGMEIVVFCPGDRQLSMRGGWALWDMLMYGEHGGEGAAYQAKHKTFRNGAQYSNYQAFALGSDAEDWRDSPNRVAGHINQVTYGIWIVGQPQRVRSRVDTSGVSLRSIVDAARRENVQRIYWGACRSHSIGAALTKKSNAAAFTPAGLQNIQVPMP